jgi:hypothetical protein
MGAGGYGRVRAGTGGYGQVWAGADVGAAGTGGTARVRSVCASSSQRAVQNSPALRMLRQPHSRARVAR